MHIICIYMKLLSRFLSALTFKKCLVLLLLLFIRKFHWCRQCRSMNKKIKTKNNSLANYKFIDKINTLSKRSIQMNEYSVGGNQSSFTSLAHFIFEDRSIKTLNLTNKGWINIRKLRFPINCKPFFDQLQINNHTK